MQKMKFWMKEKCAERKMERMRQRIEEADAVILGAGAGLSTAAGFVYDGERFRKWFSDFEEKYDFHDMYTGGFYPYKTLEEHWAYCPAEIENQLICVDGDIGEIMKQ